MTKYRRMRARAAAIGAGSAASLLVLASPAAALEAGSGEEGNAGKPEQTVEEVIVTATRRSESVRDVPFNIQAISADVLEKTGATGITDFARTVPGLSFTDYGPSGGAKLVLRGLRTGNEAGLAPTTTVYVDDVPMDMPFRGTPLDLELIDVERVEVLRGPQGTLFGGGAIGGTIRYISKKPSFAGVEGRVSAEVSDTHHGGLNYNTSGLINLPVNDWIAVRASMGYFDNDGFIDNTRLGTHDVNFDKTLASRLAVLLKPTQDLDVNFTYQRQDARYGESNSQRESQPYLTVDYPNPAHMRYTAQLSNLTLNYNLGWANLTSSSSHVDELENSRGDDTFYIRDVVFGSFLPPEDIPDLSIVQERWAKSHSFTQEIRLVSRSDGRFDWIAGGYYSTVHIHEDYQEFAPTPFAGQADFEQNILGFPLTDNKEYTYHSDTRRQSLAGFGELKYHFTDAWQASVGDRLFRERGDGNFYSIDQFFGLDARTASGNARTTPFPNELSDGSYRENGSVWRFNSSYKLGSAGLLYTTIAQGFRPGGFNLTTPNTGIPDSARQFDSDSLVSYELGGKFSLLDNRIYVSSALYRIDWSHIQTTLMTPLGFIFLGNAGKAVSQGLELELNAHDVGVTGLSLDAGYAFTDAKLTQTIPGIGFSGEHMPMVPRHTLSLMADYSVRIGAGLKAGVNLLTTYTDSSYSDFGPYKPVADPATGAITRSTDVNSQFLPLSSYWLTNLSLRLEGERWVARLFANNLFDKRYTTFKDFFPANSRFAGPDVIYNSDRPRTIGIEMTRRF